MEMTGTADVISGTAEAIVAGLGERAFLLAFYPEVVILAFITSFVAGWAIWQTRHWRGSLWFVLIGIFVTHISQGIENISLLTHRIYGAPAGPMWMIIIVKILYLIGSSLQMWGALMALFAFSRRGSYVALGIFCITLGCVYWLLVGVLV